MFNGLEWYHDILLSTYYMVFDMGIIQYRVVNEGYTINKCN